MMVMSTLKQFSSPEAQALIKKAIDGVLAPLVQAQMAAKAGRTASNGAQANEAAGTGSGKAASSHAGLTCSDILARK